MMKILHETTMFDLIDEACGEWDAITFDSSAINGTFVKDNNSYALRETDYEDWSWVAVCGRFDEEE